MLEIKHLSADMGGCEFLKDISLTLPKGTLTALVGRNGSGKSTLLHCIGGVHKCRGEISLGGDDLRVLPLRERAKRLSLLPQVLPAPHVTVEELTGFGRNPYVDIGRRLAESDRVAIRSAMKAAGVETLAARFVDELSGGERQRAYLAMTLAQETEVLLFDEPTTHLDLVAAEDFLRELTALRRQGKTLLVVMHDLTQAVHIADRVAVMEHGKLVFQGETEDFLRQNVPQRVLGLRRWEAEGRSFFTAME